MDQWCYTTKQAAVDGSYYSLSGEDQGGSMADGEHCICKLQHSCAAAVIQGWLHNN